MVIVLKFDVLLGYLFSGSFEYRKQVFVRDSFFFFWSVLISVSEFLDSSATSLG